MVAYPAISFFAFFGVHFRLPHTLCFIFSLLFGGCVPRHFIFDFFRGTFPSSSYIIFHIFLAFWWSRTPTFHFYHFSGYAPSRTSLIMASAHSSLPETYPAISFFIFLWVRASSHFTYCGFSTLIFTKNVPRYFTFAISRGTTLHHTFHTLPPTTHKSILWRRFAPEYAFLASLPFLIVFRQPEAHLPHYLPYTFADISDTSGTVSTMPSVPEMPLITSMPIEYIFTTCMYGIM